MSTIKEKKFIPDVFLCVLPENASHYTIKFWSISYLYLQYAIIFTGDEIFAVNGESLAGASHSEAIAMFKAIRSGKVVLHVGRRTHSKKR